MQISSLHDPMSVLPGFITNSVQWLWRLVNHWSERWPDRSDPDFGLDLCQQWLVLLSHFHVGASSAPVNIDFRLGREARLLFAQLLIFAQYSPPIGLGKKLLWLDLSSAFGLAEQILHRESVEADNRFKNYGILIQVSMFVSRNSLLIFLQL